MIVRLIESRKPQMADSKLKVRYEWRKSQTVQNQCWWIDDSIDTEVLRRIMMDLGQTLNVVL